MGFSGIESCWQACIESIYICQAISRAPKIILQTFSLKRLCLLVCCRLHWIKHCPGNIHLVTSQTHLSQLISFLLYVDRFPPAFMFLLFLSSPWYWQTIVQHLAVFKNSVQVFPMSVHCLLHGADVWLCMIDWSDRKVYKSGRSLFYSLLGV